MIRYIIGYVRLQCHLLRHSFSTIPKDKVKTSLAGRAVNWHTQLYIVGEAKDGKPVSCLGCTCGKAYWWSRPLEHYEVKGDL